MHLQIFLANGYYGNIMFAHLYIWVSPCFVLSNGGPVKVKLQNVWGIIKSIDSTAILLYLSRTFRGGSSSFGQPWRFAIAYWGSGQLFSRGQTWERVRLIPDRPLTFLYQTWFELFRYQMGLSRTGMLASISPSSANLWRQRRGAKFCSFANLQTEAPKDARLLDSFV